MSDEQSDTPTAHRALDSVDVQRFARLDHFARRHLAYVDWYHRLHELGLMRQVLLAALEVQIRSFREDWAQVFDPFVGSWVGGDLHDASRSYQHVWEPTRVGEDGLASQRVRMFDGSSEILAYNYCREARPQIVGLVGDKAHVGYPLPDQALLWLGEADDNQISIHAERVWANGQIYDVRGLVVDATNSPRHQEPVASDWRYHRVDDGAVGANDGD